MNIPINAIHFDSKQKNHKHDYWKSGTDFYHNSQYQLEASKRSCARCMLEKTHSTTTIPFVGRNRKMRRQIRVLHKTCSKSIPKK